MLLPRLRSVRGRWRNSRHGLTLPALADIGYRAFANMKNLTSAVLGPVTRMDAYVFSSDAALTSVHFGDGATVVGDHAFFNQAPVWVRRQSDCPTA